MLYIYCFRLFYIINAKTISKLYTVDSFTVPVYTRVRTPPLPQKNKNPARCAGFLFPDKNYKNLASFFFLVFML